MDIFRRFLSQQIWATPGVPFCRSYDKVYPGGHFDPPPPLGRVKVRSRLIGLGLALRVDWKYMKSSSSGLRLRDHLQNAAASLAFNNVTFLFIGPSKTAIMYQLGEGTRPCPFAVSGHGRVPSPRWYLRVTVKGSSPKCCCLIGFQ